MDVDSFAHPDVLKWFEEMNPPKSFFSRGKKKLVRINLPRLGDRFLLALTTVVMQLWKLNEKPRRARPKVDLQLIPLPSHQISNPPPTHPSRPRK
jgi:hypothetical protein